jgi:hypothetical protein
MDLNRVYACQKNCCKPCEYDNNIEMPHHSEIVCDSKNCQINEINPSGIGVKVNYGAPLDCKDLSKSVVVNQPTNMCRNN